MHWLSKSRGKGGNSFCVSIHFAVVDYCRFVDIKNVNDCTIMKGYRRVAIVEEFYHILKQIHDKDCLHAGSRKTYASVISISMQLKYGTLHIHAKLSHVCVTPYTL